MASTFTPQDALDYAKIMVSNMPVDVLFPQIAQDASSSIWTAGPWRWTIGALTPFPLASGVQNFSVPAPPADFLRLDRCYISNSVTMRPVKAVSSIPINALIEQLPDFVAYVPSIASIFFDSLFGPVAASDVWRFYAWYKKQAPVITAANIGTAGLLVMDDDYYWVYREWVLYYAFKYAYDARAGGATVTIGPDGRAQVQYSGQLACARAALEELRQYETVQYAFPEANPTPLKSV